MKVEEYLLEKGMNPQNLGFRYVCYAVELCRKDLNLLYKKNCGLYELMAKNLKVNKGAIVRAMQTAICNSNERTTISSFLAKAVISLE